MSGHSKWSKVKHQKGVTDEKKGRLYTIFAKKIAQAALSSRGLEAVIAQAKAASVPRDVIDRAVEKAAKKGEKTESVMFEGFFLGGKIGIIILAETDNNTRTSNEVRHIFERHGGKLGAPGAAAYLFTAFGEFSVENSPRTMDLLLESQAEDFVEEGNQIIVETKPGKLNAVVKYFKDHQIETTDPEIVYEPTVKMALSTDEKKQLDGLIDDLMSTEGIETIYDNAV